MKLPILAATVALALACGVGASAHGLDEVFAILGVPEPTILPSSPFYFFKEIGRGLRRAFTFGSVKKAELELRFTDERLAEVETLAARKPEAKAAIDGAWQNYLAAHERLQSRLESLRGKNRNVEPLLEKLASRVLDHQELFADLGATIAEADLKRATKEVTESVQKALELDRERFKAKLEEKVKKAAEKRENEELHDVFEALGEADETLEGLFEGFGEVLDRETEELHNLAEANEGLEESAQDIAEYKRKVEKERPTGMTLEEARRLIAEAEKHWGFATSALEQRDIEGAALHLGHVEGFLKELDALLKKSKRGSKPEACIQLYDPVCGVDGKTYSNACFAEVAGVTVKYRGECGKPLEPREGTTVAPAPTAIEPAPTPPTGFTPKPGGEVPPTVVEHKVEADDTGFYFGPITLQTIAVPKGATAKLTFIVRSNNVYYGGLDFRSAKFQTPAVQPGGSTTVEFVADDDLLITSYWPASGVRKAELKVTVE